MSFRGPLNGLGNALRERGYNDGFAGRGKVTRFENAEHRAQYLRGYRLGTVERDRHDADVEASRAGA